MFEKKVFAALTGIAALGLAGATAPAAASEADFFRGKTVTVMVPSTLGASLGLYGRLVTDHLSKHIPGNPTVIIQERPGGGGTVGATFAYNVAPRDGTFIAQILAPSILAPLLREMRYDSSKFVWLGSQTPRPAVVSLWHEAPIKTLEGAKQGELIMGSTGRGSETFIIPRLMNELLGTKFRIVTGYPGGAEVNLAMERGEVHGRMQYWTGWTAGKPDWVRDNKLVHFVQYGPVIPELKDVPRFRDIVDAGEARQMVDLISIGNEIGMGYYVHPDVPEGRVAALRQAFADMHKDPAYLKDAETRNADIDFVSGETIQETAQQAFSAPASVVERLKKILATE